MDCRIKSRNDEFPARSYLVTSRVAPQTPRLKIIHYLFRDSRNRMLKPWQPSSAGRVGLGAAYCGVAHYAPTKDEFKCILSMVILVSSARAEIAQVSGGKNSGSAFPPTNGPFFPRGTGVPSGGNG